MTHGHFDKKCFIENLLCPSKVDNFWEASKRNHSINLSLTRSNLQVVSYHSYFTMDLFPPSLRQTMFHTLLEWTIIKGMSLRLGRARHLETFNLQLHLSRSSITMFHCIWYAKFWSTTHHNFLSLIWFMNSTEYNIKRCLSIA